MDEHIPVKVQDLKPGMQVDLQSCPLLHDHPSAEFEYAVVMEVEPGYPGFTLVSYTEIDTANYENDTVLKVQVQ